MMQRLTVERETAGAIRHQPFALRCPHRLAQIGFGVQAILAFAAFRGVQGNHVVPGADGFDLAAGFDHNAGAFMAQNRRKQPLGILSRQGECIRMAQPGGLEFYQHFLRSGPL